MKRIESQEYFDAVRAYFADHKEPAWVYAFLLNTLWKDNYKLPDKMFYERVNALKPAENCFCFYTGSEVILVLCSEPRK